MLHIDHGSDNPQDNTLKVTLPKDELREEEEKRQAETAKQISFRHMVDADKRYKAEQARGNEAEEFSESKLVLDWIREWRTL